MRVHSNCLQDQLPEFLRLAVIAFRLKFSHFPCNCCSKDSPLIAIADITANSRNTATMRVGKPIFMTMNCRQTETRISRNWFFFSFSVVSLLWRQPKEMGGDFGAETRFSRRFCSIYDAPTLREVDLFWRIERKEEKRDSGGGMRLGNSKYRSDELTKMVMNKQCILIIGRPSACDCLCRLKSNTFWSLPSPLRIIRSFI